MEEKHVRRQHYSGKYPKKFEEKYKEQNPDKYKDTVEHVIAKGSTPAGMHISIMVDEILGCLRIQPGERGLDCTFGYGGHTTSFLEKVGACGHVTSLDIDLEESAKTLKRLRDKGYGEDVLSLVNTNFANIDQVAKEYGKFDFVLADLGVSSMQIDNSKRGFSYKVDGPLDLRLDQSRGVTASERLMELDEEELIGLLIENSDEPYAKEIAHQVDKIKRSGKTISTTFELRDAIKEALFKVPKEDKDEAIKKSCARVFQALRIDINQEFESLYQLLDKLPECLNPGARVAFLTFHSGEDRLVKKAFKEGYKNGIYSEISDDVIRPSAKECITNPRAKSTKLRWCRFK